MANSSSIKPKQEHPLRLRVFAGPNGSGKSTIIHAVKNVTVHDKPIDFGYYINADDIARELRNGPFSFDPFQFQIESNTFIAFAKNSGLLTEKLSLKTFEESFSVKS
jgi:predicted ATP-binding protein involved in virulence